MAAAWLGIGVSEENGLSKKKKYSNRMASKNENKAAW
jgi:hypothetical protein